jgi:hypothetical protein
MSEARKTRPQSPWIDFSFGPSFRPKANCPSRRLAFLLSVDRGYALGTSISAQFFTTDAQCPPRESTGRGVVLNEQLTIHRHR